MARPRQAPLIDHARLLQVMHYDPLTGLFTRLKRCNRHADKTGSIDGYGRPIIVVDQIKYHQGRLAWFYVHGRWPVGFIDHRDGKPLNMVFTNLRDVTNSVNMQNQRRPMVTNQVGLLGVIQRKTRYVGTIELDGKKTHLGYFATADEAHQAYLTAKRRLHIGCTI